MSIWAPTTYKTKNRSDYDRALKQRGSLSIWFDAEMTWDAEPSAARQWMHCAKLLGQRLSARDFERQDSEIQIRAAILNGFTVLGIPHTEAVG